MFFLLIIISIITIIVLLIITSSLKLEFKNFEITYPKKDNRILNRNFEIYLKVYILGKIRIAKINVTKLKLKKNKKTKIRENKENIDFKIIDILKNKKTEIEKINVKAFIGFEDAAFTAILIGTIYTAISVLVGSQMNKFNKAIKADERSKMINKVSGTDKKSKIESKVIYQTCKKNNSNYEIEITPIYNTNIINAKIECIIKTKLRDIIHIIYVLNKKRRVKENGRTSNRGTYAYSDE